MENKKPVTDPYRSALKKRAMAFMPKNYEDIHAQQQILSMIVAVVPAAAGCARAAEANLWPKVQSNALPIIQAVGQCAMEVNKAIAAAPLESLLLEKRSSETLTKAWVALEYYSYLMLPEYSVNIRGLRDRIFAILRQRETAQPAAPQPPVQVPQFQAEDPNKTVMVERSAPAFQAEDPNKTVMVSREPEIPAAPEKTVFQAPAAAQAPGSTVAVARQQSGKGKKSKAPVAVIAAVAVVIVLVVIITSMGGKAVEKVEEAIAAIGTVTLESKEKIETAEGLYEDLSKGKQEKVENRDVLHAARSEYDRQAGAVAAVEEAIDAIGSPVTLKSGDAVKKARKLYDALETALQDDVSNYSDLKTKEKTYNELYNEDQAGTLYNAAKAAYDSGDYETAISKIDDLLAKYPSTTAVTAAKSLGADCVDIAAEKAINENRLEDAMTMLKQAQASYLPTEKSTALMERLTTKLAGMRPANGKMFAVKTEQGYCKMVITAKGSDLCIKLTSKDNPEKYTLYYIREGEKFAMHVKDGKYTLEYAFGEYWYGQEEMFGQEGTYRKMDATFELSTYYSGGWVQYEYYEFTLDINGDWAETDITRDQF